jgi:hypothetical protein
MFLSTPVAGVSEVVGLSGGEKVDDTKFNQRRKTYWHDSSTN